MKTSPNIFRERQPEETSGMRLYFMAGRPVPLIDPRDVPRGWQGYPETNFKINLRRGALAAAIAGSFLDAYATGDFDSAFKSQELAATPLPTIANLVEVEAIPTVDPSPSHDLQLVA